MVHCYTTGYVLLKSCFFPLSTDARANNNIRVGSMRYWGMSRFKFALCHAKGISGEVKVAISHSWIAGISTRQGVSNSLTVQRRNPCICALSSKYKGVKCRPRKAKGCSWNGHSRSLEAADPCSTPAIICSWVLVFLPHPSSPPPPMLM